MMEKTQATTSIKTFISLLLSLKIPKWALVIGLGSSVITTLVGLAVPLLTRNLVAGFSVDAISPGLIGGLVAAFILPAVINGISIYLLSMVGQKIVANLRSRHLTDKVLLLFFQL